MKALVVFDTNYGNTKRIADRIARQLGNGTSSVSVNDLTKHSLDGIDLLLVGSPINAWNPTKKITAFLNGLNPARMKGMKAAAFDTRVKFLLSGNAAKKIARALRNSGAVVIEPPMGFYVIDNEGPLLEGETEKAEEWASTIKSNI
jgi:menaquinone-dependent protoporphyrinogen IX oxidase